MASISGPSRQSDGRQRAVSTRGRCVVPERVSYGEGVWLGDRLCAAKRGVFYYKNEYVLVNKKVSCRDEL